MKKIQTLKEQILLLQELVPNTEGSVIQVKSAQELHEVMEAIEKIHSRAKKMGKIKFKTSNEVCFEKTRINIIRIAYDYFCTENNLDENEWIDFEYHDKLLEWIQMQFSESTQSMSIAFEYYIPKYLITTDEMIEWCKKRMPLKQITTGEVIDACFNGII